MMTELMAEAERAKLSPNGGERGRTEERVHRLRLMARGHGDREIATWDDRPETIDYARLTFEREMVAGRLAFAIDGAGGSCPITKFDPTAENILIVPAIQGGCDENTATDPPMASKTVADLEILGAARLSARAGLVSECRRVARQIAAAVGDEWTSTRYPFRVRWDGGQHHLEISTSDHTWPDEYNEEEWVPDGEWTPKTCERFVFFMRRDNGESPADNLIDVFADELQRGRAWADDLREHLLVSLIPGPVIGPKAETTAACGR